MTLLDNSSSIDAVDSAAAAPAAASPLALDELGRGRAAIVTAVENSCDGDAVARRLRELGFVAGELVTMLATGPFGREPLVVQVGFTRFALRRAEARRIRVRPAPG